MDFETFTQKMMDFETFTPCTYLNSIQMCTYFCKDLVTEYCLYLVKIRFPTLVRFEIDFIIPRHVVIMGLMLREIRVYFFPI